MAATPLTTTGRFLRVEETERELRIIDESRTVRQGSTVTVRLLTALAASRPYSAGGTVRVFEHFVAYDCPGRRQRLTQGAAAGEDFNELDRRHYPDEAWSAVNPQTASGTVFDYVCLQKSLPRAGDDFAVVARAYWRSRII